ncbi:MAG: M23 family metallopeptidase [Lachnospiraceae bacterium]|nr:M23 family metallopeptidase [Lachnospiraceae bacterium]
MKNFQKKNRSGLARERWIMAAGSLVVLGALTLTGVYVRNLSNQTYDEYIVDFTALEDFDRSANRMTYNDTYTDIDPDVLAVIDHPMPTDYLDYDPFYQETSTTNVENAEPASRLSDELKEQIGGMDPDLLIANIETILEGITSNDLDIGELIMASEDRLPKPKLPEASTEEKQGANVKKQEQPVEEKKPEATPDAGASLPAISTSMQSSLSFKETDNLVWPVVGNVLINYSMDKSVYFPTLKQYKYNPAIIIQAAEGDIITAAAGGKVTSVFNDPQIGDAITMELGSGYEITYGQLKNILVSEGSFVAAGDVVAEVASPTKYFSVEGTNIYFKLTKDGSPVNPLTKLK